MNYEEIVCDANNLYRAYKVSVKGSKWKESTQKFMMNFLRYIFEIQDDIINRTLQNGPTQEFDSSKYKFLQIKYTLTDTGKVIKRINPDRVTAMRRKLKKLAIKVGNGEADYDNVENMFRGWMGGHYKLLSREQRKNLIQLYEDLFSKEITIVNKKLIVSDRSA